MSCFYCYHNDEKNLPFKKGMMDFKTAQLIITDAANIGVSSIKFNWKGESTLNPKFKEITTLAKKLSTGSTFIDRITNSNFKFLTTKENIFEGLCNQTKVKISFDSFIPEVMEKQREGAIHSLIMKNIDYFYNHPERKNTEIVIQAVRTNLNKDEDLEGQVKKRWPEATLSVRDMVTGRVNNDLTSLENKKRDDSQRQSCLQANNRLVFNWEGKAMVCCVDIGEKLNVGNIHDSSIYEIFNSIEAQKIRRSLKDKSAFLFDPCKSCSSFESYRGYKPPFKS
jgi:radical SAM protein with 4Fe4S-binding SPASM domain